MQNLSHTLSSYARLARAHKPIGYYLLLAPVLWALWLSKDCGVPAIDTLAIFVAGVFLMRSAGCVINDYLDRDLDVLVERTQQRPLASGEISPQPALLFFAALIALALVLVSLTNIQTIALSFIALLLAMTYPLMKRFHHLPQLHLGLAFGWAIPMAYSASTGEWLPPLAIWLLYASNITWVLAYDTIYALADRQDDIAAGIKSSAIYFGKYDRCIIAALQFMTLLLWFYIGTLYGFSYIYNTALALAALLFIYQQFLIRDYQPQRCIQSFTNNAWVGAIVFAGIAIERIC